MAPKKKIPLYKMRLTRDGYDENGRYWGTGEPLYCAEMPDGTNVYVRAADRAEAAAKIAPQIPNHS